MAETEDFPLPAEACPEFGTIESDRLIFDALRDLRDNSQHKERWGEAREFEDDESGLLRAKTAFAPVIDEGKRHQEAVDTWLPVLISEHSFIELQRAIGTLYARSDVGAHLQQGGTLVFVLAPHLTYADIPVAKGAASLVSPEIPKKQTSFIHRQVALHELREQDAEGVTVKHKVVDDGLLLIGSVMQTLPDSQSGRDDRFAPYRDDMGALVRKELENLIERGDQIIWLADSGTEAKFDPTTDAYVVGRVTRKNAPLLYLYNARGADKVMAVPLTMDIDPFGDNGDIIARDVPFELGEPRILHSRDEVHAMKLEQIDVMNRIKRPELPLFRYETADELEARIGRKA